MKACCYCQRNHGTCSFAEDAQACTGYPSVLRLHGTGLGISFDPSLIEIYKGKGGFVNLLIVPVPLRSLSGSGS